MTRSRSLRVIVAISVASCALAALPLAGSAHTSPTVDSAGERIVAGPSQACAAQRWPDIDRKCLTAANGSHPGRVRAVKEGAEADRDRPLLLRSPSVVALR